MLENEINIIKNTLTHCYGDAKYFSIFLLVLLILFLELKNKENKNILIYYPALVLAIVLNPLFCKIILKFIGENVYYRFFWLLPVGLLIAYFGTMLISRANTKSSRVIIWICFIFIIVFSGKFMYTSYTFEEVNNLYKLPDEYVQIVDIIKSIPIDEKKTMTSPSMIGYIRQLDASIELAYGRRPYGDYDGIDIVTYYLIGDIKIFTDICKEEDVNIIVYDRSIHINISPSYFGYILYAQTENYDIYVSEEEMKKAEVAVNSEVIEIEGINESYKLAVVNDLHLIAKQYEVDDELKDTVKNRYETIFKSRWNETSQEVWRKIPQKLNDINPNLVVFAGDMIDYASSSNVNILKSGMNNINNEIIYLRADHDYGKWYNKNLSEIDVEILHKSIDENADIYCEDLGEILVIGIDNSTSQIEENVLEQFQKMIEIGKPIILVTHVPFNSKANNELDTFSRTNREDRNLTWDYEGTSYDANESTESFLDIIYSDNSPVKAIIAGHLHHKYTGNITNNTIQYIIEPSYLGKVTEFTIQGE